MPPALKRFKVSELDFMLDSGEIPPNITDWIEEAIKTAKESPDGETAIQAFVEDDSEESDEADSDA